MQLANRNSTGYKRNKREALNAIVRLTKNMSGDAKSLSSEHKNC
jgi:hypothetical protein